MMSSQEDISTSFAGQKKSAKQIRMSLLKKLADESIFANKNEIGLIIDLICSCLNPDPSKRPSIRGLLHSPLFIMDKYEGMNA
jgi:serine/threonine protein kinase